MNIKPSHLKKDSNPFRQKQNEREKQSMKNQFVSTSLMDVPEQFHLRNKAVYQCLVGNLERLGLAIHLKGIDTYSLVSIANTIDLLSEVERDLQKYGTAQKIVTRENFEKFIPTPYVQMRSQTINLLQSQLKQLQLDPQSRQLLTNAVLNDVSMIQEGIDEDDDLFNTILGRLN